jgi:hypothetical protein
MTPEFNIAVLLPTRGRAEMLERSIQSLISLAKDPNQIQLMLAFDNDDEGHRRKRLMEERLK